MEGAYHKILQSRSSIPSPQFQVFLDMLVSTVRDAIAVCLLPRSTVRAPRVDSPPRIARRKLMQSSASNTPPAFSCFPTSRNLQRASARCSDALLFYCCVPAPTVRARCGSSLRRHDLCTSGTASSAIGRFAAIKYACLRRPFRKFVMMCNQSHSERVLRHRIFCCPQVRTLTLGRC